MEQTQKKKIYEISEEAVMKIRNTLGQLPHDSVNSIIVFFERNLVLKQDKPADIPAEQITN